MKKFLSLLLCLSLLFCTGIAAYAVEEYDVWVAGVRVTSANAGDVLGNATVIYESSSNTIRLTDAVLEQAYTFADGSAAIYSVNDLNIELRGSSIVTLTLEDSPMSTGNYGIYSSRALRFVGDGSISVQAPAYGIYACSGLEITGCKVSATASIFAVFSIAGELNISDGNVTANATGDKGYGICNFDGNVTIQNSTIFSVGNYGLLAQNGGEIIVVDSLVTLAGHNHAMYFHEDYLTLRTSTNRNMYIKAAADMLGIAGIRLISNNYNLLGYNSSRFVFIDSQNTLHIVSLLRMITMQFKLLGMIA